MNKDIMPIMSLIIRGKWKTPNHSRDKRKDDTHEIKTSILKVVGSIYKKEVGNNPDLDIEPETNKIVLKATAEKFFNKTFVTEINAEEFFELSIITCNEPVFYRYTKFYKMSYYVIPPDIEILVLVIDYILEQDNIDFEVVINNYNLIEDV